MGHKKLIRFEQIKTFPNVLIFPEGMQQRWHEHFGNSNPLTLELACGKGEYTLAMAKMYPDRNFIGVDIKGNRIWKGARAGLDEGIRNAAFLRTDISRLREYFGKAEVEEIWITFADPFLRKSKQKKRLTHIRFLHMYQDILVPGGKIHLKTDSRELYEFTLDTIHHWNCRLHGKIEDIYAEDQIDGLLNIRTYYETLHLQSGRTIRYLSFSLPDHLLKAVALDHV
jgi:tRNA (guanine-N7-)-methyltransferase